MQPPAAPAPATFLSLYKAHCGRTEVPEPYHLWVSLALIASCVSDRVWIEKLRGSRWVPNLYVLLLGPSGLGKGEAINTACRLVKPYTEKQLGADGQPLPMLNVYYGKATGQYVADFMSGRERDAPRRVTRRMVRKVEPKQRLMLVNEELALDIGRGPQADDFIKYMTGLYSGSPLPFRDGTRTAGEAAVPNPCLNWLAGTTEEWLVASVTRDAIEGGFFARVVTVVGDYDLDNRVPEPTYPLDYDAIVAALRRCVEILLTVAEGPVAMTPSAQLVANHWYSVRPTPADEQLLPTWKRQPVLVYKVAMLLALSSWVVRYALWQDDGAEGLAPELVIDRAEIIAAQRMLVKVQAPIGRLTRSVAATPSTAAALALERWISRRPDAVMHSRVTQILSARGWPYQVVLDAIRELERLGLVRAEIRRGGPKGTGRQSTWYTWLGRRRFRRVATKLEELVEPIEPPEPSAEPELPQVPDGAVLDRAVDGGFDDLEQAEPDPVGEEWLH